MIAPNWPISSEHHQQQVIDNRRSIDEKLTKEFCGSFFWIREAINAGLGLGLALPYLMVNDQ